MFVVVLTCCFPQRSATTAAFAGGQRRGQYYWDGTGCISWLSQFSQLYRHTTLNALGRSWNVISMCSGMNWVCSRTSRSLKITPEAQPCYHHLHSYAPRSRVEAELNQLQWEGEIEPVEHADWAAPIMHMPIVKSDGLIRICDDF